MGCVVWFILGASCIDSFLCGYNTFSIFDSQKKLPVSVNRLHREQRTCISYGFETLGFVKQLYLLQKNKKEENGYLIEQQH